MIFNFVDILDGTTIDIFIINILDNVHNYSIKELKENITNLGGITTDCLEKSDLQKRLRYILLDKLSNDSLKIIGTKVLGDIEVDMKTIDRKILIELILQSHLNNETK